MLILLLVVCNTMHAQEWITDDDFDVKISGKNAYGESYAVVVVEFYASFNKDNEFKDWDLLEGVKYYKCDIKKAPQAKKNYKASFFDFLKFLKCVIPQTVKWLCFVQPIN
mgnify:CR=1 FL=1